MRPSKKIIDSVSASELLRALNTLQHMGEDCDPEISFSDDSKACAPTNSKIINFDQYMARKGEGKSKNVRNAQRKSISPIRHDQTIQNTHLSDLKSRSHSPISKKPEKTERSMIPHKNNHAHPQPVRPSKENK